MTDELRKRVHSIADHYGYDAQSDILLEEMAELQKEILKRRRWVPNRQEIVEEMADVMIMLEQVRYLLMIDDDELHDAMTGKVMRQEIRIAKEEN